MHGITISYEEGRAGGSYGVMIWALSSHSQILHNGWAGDEQYINNISGYGQFVTDDDDDNDDDDNNDDSNVLDYNSDDYDTSDFD